MAERKNLNKIDGWLIIFLITLFFSALLALAGMAEAGQLDIEIAANASLLVVTAIMLARRKSYARKLVRVVLITMLVTSVFTMFIDVSELTGTALQDYVSQSMKSIVYLAVWLTYVYKSERVRQVYAKLKEPVSGYQIWPILGLIYALFSPTFGIVFSGIALNNISKNNKLKGMGISIAGLVISIAVFLIYIFAGIQQGTY